MRFVFTFALALSVLSPFATAQTPLSPGGSASEIVISAPGSYVLTGNKFGTFGASVQNLSLRSAIRIDASNVVLDLGGFTVGYPLTSCSGSLPPISCTVPTAGLHENNKVLAGISVNPSATNVTIRNGTIQGAWTHGIDCGAGCTVQDVSVRLSNGFGIRAGVRANIQDVVIEQTVNTALHVGSRSLVKNVNAHIGNHHGIWAAAEANIQDVAVNSFGSAGISTLMGSSIRNCNVAHAGLLSVEAGLLASGSSVSNCTFSNNPSAAVQMQDGMIRDSLLYQNGQGLILSAPGKTAFGGLTITTVSGPAIQGSGQSIAPSSCNGSGC